MILEKLSILNNDALESQAGGMEIDKCRNITINHGRVEKNSGFLGGGIIILSSDIIRVQNV